MENIKWITLGYIIFFQAYLFYINTMTKKKTGMDILGKHKEVKISVLLTLLLYTAALLSLFSGDIYMYMMPVRFMQSGLVKITGVVILTAGLAVVVIASRRLGNSWRFGMIENQKTELIQTGIYAFIRNPYFLAYFTMFSGLFLITPGMILLLIIIAAICSFHNMIKLEEIFLQKMHGNIYTDYCCRAGRYLPKFSR